MSDTGSNEIRNPDYNLEFLMNYVLQSSTVQKSLQSTNIIDYKLNLEIGRS